MNCHYCPDCGNGLIKYPWTASATHINPPPKTTTEIHHFYHCPTCQKNFVIIDDQWVEIFPETELDEVITQARKLVNQ